MGMWSKKKEAEPEPEPEPEALEPEPEPEPPLRFDRAHVNLLLSDDGVTVVGDSSFRCAASGAPMSGGGRYYAYALLPLFPIFQCQQSPFDATAHPVWHGPLRTASHSPYPATPLAAPCSSGCAAVAGSSR